MGFKAVTFDVFSALFDWESTLTPLVRDRGVDAPAFVRAWRQKQLAYAQLDTMLGRGHTGFRRLTELSFEHTSKSFGAPTVARSALLGAWSALEPYPEVRGVLAALRRGTLLLALLSNGDRDMLSELAGRLGVRFDDIFSAEEAGVYKPHPRIYSLPLVRWGLEREDVLHVAGSTTDALGSKAFGLPTVLVNRKKTALEELGEPPDYIIDDLSALPRLLK
ncbi:MAG: haloacid dehalogenase type II [Nitrososphaerota archaeon]|nr:haloacid dehalogenase type II [Nitrososphaerota archaeon]